MVIFSGNRKDYDMRLKESVIQAHGQQGNRTRGPLCPFEHGREGGQIFVAASSGTAGWKENVAAGCSMCGTTCSTVSSLLAMWDRMHGVLHARPAGSMGILPVIMWPILSEWRSYRFRANSPRSGIDCGLDWVCCLRGGGSKGASRSKGQQRRHQCPLDLLGFYASGYDAWANWPNATKFGPFANGAAFVYNGVQCARSQRLI